MESIMWTTELLSLGVLKVVGSRAKLLVYPIRSFPPTLELIDLFRRLHLLSHDVAHLERVRDHPLIVDLTVLTHSLLICLEPPSCPVLKLLTPC